MLWNGWLQSLWPRRGNFFSDRNYTSKRIQSQTDTVIAATITWLACSDSTCQQGESQVTLKFPIASNETESLPTTKELFSSIRSFLQPLDANSLAENDSKFLALADNEKVNLPPQTLNDPTNAPADSASENIFLAFVFAFLGGFLLNLMPCVLPVISFKIWVC